jgi:hypothetical protein
MQLHISRAQNLHYAPKLENLSDQDWENAVKCQIQITYSTFKKMRFCNRGFCIEEMYTIFISILFNKDLENIHKKTQSHHANTYKPENE